MTMLSLFFLLYLTPAITQRVEDLRADAGVDLSDLTRMPPERVGLRRLHTLYMVLDAGKLALGALSLWLFASRRPR